MIPSRGDIIEVSSGLREGAHCCLIVFAIDNRESFDSVKKWRQKVEAECGPDLVTVLVQNKLDLYENATMSKLES